MSGFDLGPALLFCPADRPDRFEKAAQRSDAVILDLEDAVAPGEREGARAAVRAGGFDPRRTIVRVGPLESDEVEADLACARDAGIDTVMVPKAMDAERIARLDLRVIALCETAAGVLAAPRIAQVPNVVALMWGAEDLVASLGGTSSRRADGSYRDVAGHARSAVLLAAGAAGRAAIDTVHFDIDDLDGVAAEAADAAAVGFSATACIHPSHVRAIRRAYRPTREDIESARAVLSAADVRVGAFRFRGRLIDEPVLRHARRVIERATPPG